MILIIIGIDIDGVVNDLTLFHVACGTKYCLENNISYNVTNTCLDSIDIFQWTTHTDELFWKRYYLQLLLHSEFIRPFASEVTKQLIEEGHIVIFVTARKEQDLPHQEPQSMFRITQKYLDENHIYYSELVLSQHKEKVITSRNIDIMVEDNPLFFNHYGSILDISLLCFDTLYNTHISGKNITRVYSWYDILQKIHSIERNYSEYKKKF